MGLILCEDNRTVQPYYFRPLNLNVYSIEELCYCIYENPYLVLDGFVDDRLKDFVQDVLRKKIYDNCSEEELLIIILSGSDYYSAAEIDHYKTVISEILKLPRYEYLKRKADYLFGLSQYENAFVFYQQALAAARNLRIKDIFYCDVNYNIGCCMANIFKYKEAFRYFETAYGYQNKESILKSIYFLSKNADILEDKLSFAAVLPREIPVEWDREYEDCNSKSAVCDEITMIESALEKDSIRRSAEFSRLLKKCKRDFRTNN